MTTPELISYINQRLAAGKNRDEITAELIMSGGWQRSDVSEAFNNLAVPVPKQKKKHSNAPLIITIIILLLAGAGYYYLVIQKKEIPIPREYFPIR